MTLSAAIQVTGLDAAALCPTLHPVDAIPSLGSDRPVDLTGRILGRENGGSPGSDAETTLL
jgi:hypothetical protein